MSVHVTYAVTPERVRRECFIYFNASYRTLLSLVCVLVCGWGANSAEILHNVDSISLNCHMKSLDHYNFPHPSNYSSIRVSMKITIIECVPPRISYASVFNKHNINITRLDVLELIAVPVNETLSALHFANLAISRLKITNENPASLLRLDPIFLSPLTNLMDLELERVFLPPLAISTRVQRVSLMDGKSMDAWGGCSYLRELSIAQWDVPKQDESWLAQCHNLRKLRLTQLSTSTLLTVLNNAQHIIPNLLSLEFSQNVVSYESLLILLSHLPRQLEELDISQSNINKLGNNSLLDKFQQLPLRQFSLAHNSFGDFCTHYPGFTERKQTHFSPSRTLEKLSLRATGATQLCFGEWFSLRELDVSENRIENIHIDSFPDSLLLLDIRDNRLSRIEEPAAKALFGIRARRIRLAGNPLACDCGNLPFLAVLQAHSAQVEDYDNVTCIGDKHKLRHVDFAKICLLQMDQVTLTAALAASGALVGLVALAAALYYRFGSKIKLFLYSCGWCLSCVREDELDSDRRYDAFVSFAHTDERFVVDELLPGLENGPQAWRLCVHYRDWIPGELIPTQIVRSVEQSRRTIIVLSQNFVQSLWSMLEFRTAQMNALRDGRVRVIVIVLDDVVDDEGLDAELRRYLRTNTFLRWSDPWFWPKLRYALPHRPAVSQEKSTPVLGDTKSSVTLDSGVELETQSSLQTSQTCSGTTSIGIEISQ